jgi:hypothetical protein
VEYWEIEKDGIRGMRPLPIIPSFQCSNIPKVMRLVVWAKVLPPWQSPTPSPPTQSP